MKKNFCIHNSVSVIVVDMLPMFRLGMVTTLKSLTYIDKIFEAQNGTDTKLILLNEKVQIIYLISRIVGFDSIALSREIIQSYPSVRIIYLSIDDDEEEIVKMVQIGVHGFISKFVDKVELDEAIKTVSSNSKFFTPEISNVLAKKLCNSRLKSGTHIELNKDRTRDVLFLVCHELSNSEIANLLFLSHRTIEYYRKKINILTGSKNPFRIFKFALSNGILEDECLLNKWESAISTKIEKRSIAC